MTQNLNKANMYNTHNAEYISYCLQTLSLMHYGPDPMLSSTKSVLCFG